MIGCLLLAAVFEKIALIDSLDFAHALDIETRKGTVEVLDHVMLSHPTAIWWRDKGGGRVRYPSRAELSPASETPFDKRRLPREDVYGWLRMDSGVEIYPIVKEECARRNLRFGVHTTWEENHWCAELISNWTIAHPEFWSCKRGGIPWMGCCSIAYPEVVAHKLETLDERLALGGDTIFLDLLRAGEWWPSREYVKPMIDEWRRLYRCDPPENWEDERWLKLVSGHVQDYLRKFADRCHAKGVKFVLGIHRVELGDRFAWARQFGLDWRALARDGVIDGLVVMNVIPDWKDPWNSTRAIYDDIVAHRANAKIYFPVAMYDYGLRGIPSYARQTGLSTGEVARRLYEMAWEAGGAGVVLECVDHRNYPPEVNAVLADVREARTPDTAQTAAGPDPVRYADPFVGTGGTAHTFPGAACPFALVQAGPDTGSVGWDYCGGYRHEDREIVGFSQTHISGTGWMDLGDAMIMPVRGEPTREGFPKSRFRHETEKASPGFYRVTLDDADADVEVTASEHVACYTVRYRGPSAARLLVDTQHGFVSKEETARTRVLEASVAPIGRDAIGGTVVTRHWVKRGYAFKAAFSRPFVRAEPLPAHDPREKGPRYLLTFDLKAGEPLYVKVALSAEGGRAGVEKNLAAEVPGWDFGAVRAAAEAKWRRLLSRVTIEGDEDAKRNFFTSVYHLCLHPNDLADAGERPFYSTFSTWDTFRAAHPLFTLLCPERVPGMVDSMLAQGRRTGHLPVWTLWGVENQCMVGTHSVPVIVDWFLKELAGGEGGRGGVDLGYWQSAYDQVKETLTRQHAGRTKENWDLYDRYGYYPFDRIRGESVSRTLECAYDDWCAAQMAKRLGRDEDAAFFLKRAGYWRNVIDPALGLARGKDTNGRWRTPFDPLAIGHGAENDNDFTEGNSWQYTWHVMQDPEGLAAVLGGRERTVARLDRLFAQDERLVGDTIKCDITGLIGQYVHGNEPSHHVPYLYTLLGRPDKAADRIREICEKFYSPRPDGLCGNDDCGQMSAWYIFSSLGFYPFNPCGGDYVLGAPQVARGTLNPSGKRPFTVIAKGFSKENRHVRSVTLDGRPLAGCVLRHADILRGGELVFEMER